MNTPLDFGLSRGIARFGPARDTGRPRQLGNLAGSDDSDSTSLYQPQDGAAETRSRWAELTPRSRRLLAGEPEDARLTGGTRSLMRRLSGLNITVPRRGPLPTPKASAA